MRQTRHMSLIETICNVSVGYVLAVITQILVFPLFGLHPEMHENFLIAAIFTVIAVVRSFTVRRLFERFRG